jgi:hypothetical protein
MSETEALRMAPRGAPLVATAARLGAAVGTLALVFIALDEAYGSLTRRSPWVPSPPVLVIALGLMSALCWSTLRAEEFRLARELRTARSGTPALRAMFAARRPPASFFARMLSTRLGMAAVLLADGSQPEARAALAGGSLLMRGGRLERLRHVVEADLERANGTPGSLERCVQNLRAVQRIGNREADLYRTHVRVKALLELGDAKGADDLAEELEASRDEEERLYLVWLRVWFDLDADVPKEGGEEEDEAERSAASAERGARRGAWRPISEGELRMGTLLARAHGAEMLVKKLDARLAAIAHPVKGE